MNRIGSMTTTPLLSVLYSSNATEPFDDALLGELLAQSRADNQRAGLTGMLLYRAGRFIQVLEGAPDAVRALVDRIRDDPRHRDMRILIEQPVEDRQFASWTMGYEPIRPRTGPVPEGFRDTFEDLENLDDANAVTRAAGELSLWFRARAARRG